MSESLRELVKDMLLLILTSFLLSRIWMKRCLRDCGG